MVNCRLALVLTTSVAIRLIVASVSSSVVTATSAATGASLPGVPVRLTVAVLDALPAVLLYWLQWSNKNTRPDRLLKPKWHEP